MPSAEPSEKARMLFSLVARLMMDWAAARARAAWSRVRLPADPKRLRLVNVAFLAPGGMNVGSLQIDFFAVNQVPTAMVTTRLALVLGLEPAPGDHLCLRPDSQQAQLNTAMAMLWACLEGVKRRWAAASRLFAPRESWSSR